MNSQAIRKITVGSKRVRGVAFAQSPGTGATPHGKVRRHRPVVHEGESVTVCGGTSFSSVGLSPPDRSDSSLSPQPRSTHSTSSELPRRRLFDCESSHESGILTAGVPSYPRTNFKLHVVKLAKRRSSRACLRERRWSVVRLASFYTHARRHTQVHQSQSHTHAHANTHAHAHAHTRTHTHAHTHKHTHTHTRTHTHASLLNFSNTYTKCTNTLCMSIFSQEFLYRNHRLATVIS